MSLASNVKVEIEGTDKINKLSDIRDKVESFDEIKCSSHLAALGRYSAKDTINVLKKFAELVKSIL